MQTRNKKLKRENGITLVALVVTIVVLLILSGVTIATLLGDNGIIAQAKKAAELTKRSTVISSVQLDILTAEMEGEITQEKLEEILNKYGTIEKNDPENPDKVTGLKVEGVTDSIPIEELYPEGITGGGNTPTPQKGTSADDIANETDKSKYYGKEVDYTVGDSTLQSGLETDGIKWKIFYAGSDFSTDGKSHIYLITDDYIARTAIPKSSGGHALNDGDSSYPKAAYFTNILGDYSGSASITDSTIRKLNNSYFTRSDTSAVTNNNMKAVAYMCDTNAWSVYKGTKADYAIGGPTIEILMKSYSQAYSVDYKAQASNATGYQISKDGGSSWSNSYSGMLSTSDSLYVITSKSNALRYWLASPLANNSSRVMNVGCDGLVNGYEYSSTPIGFRPLVCLSSDVKLEQQSDGTFKIVEVASDTTAPEVSISLSATSAETGTTITATVTHTDDKSEVDIKKCKYLYNTTSGNLGTTNAKWDTASTFNTNPQSIDLLATTEGTYYLHVLTVDTAGNKGEKVSEPIEVTTSGTSADDIESAADKSQYYGKEVDYIVGDSTLQSDLESDGIKWKIFYVGSNFSTDKKNRIYLIANDYIEVDNLPYSTDSNGSKTSNKAYNNDSTYPKAAIFAHENGTLDTKGVLKDYSGSSRITNTEIKKLNNDYFNVKKYSNTNNSMRAVAYMLDIDAWSAYKGAKADYAVGGPSVEMVMKSYSQTHGVDYRAQASSEKGYQISKDGGENWADYCSGMLSTSDSLYVITSTSNAKAYWLSSPSALAGLVMRVHYDGYVIYSYLYNCYNGFRPLVCLSSDVKLEQQSNGTFRIK